MIYIWGKYSHGTDNERKVHQGRLMYAAPDGGWWSSGMDAKRYAADLEAAKRAAERWAEQMAEVVDETEG